jgi:hypothetical protein
MLETVQLDFYGAKHRAASAFRFRVVGRLWVEFFVQIAAGNWLMLGCFARDPEYQPHRVNPRQLQNPAMWLDPRGGLFGPDETGKGPDIGNLTLREAPALHDVSELTAAAIGAPITLSGVQGHPSSVRNLVRPELDRRNNASETLPTMKAEAEALSQWLANTHPSAPQVGGRSLETSLRLELRAAVSAIKERDIK